MKPSLYPAHSSFAAVALTGLCAFVLQSPLALAQGLPAIPPETLSLLNDRVEALAILGGDYGASGGAYTFRGGTGADLSVAKFGGGGDISSPMPTGLGNLKWNPTLSGNIGYISADGTVEREPLTGNTLEVSTFGLELGTGARFWFTEHFSLAPEVSGMYGHIENEFHALTPSGEEFEGPMTEAGWVNWTADTWSVVPSVNAQYLWNWGRVAFNFQSTFRYFYTESFDTSTPLVNVIGHSQMWENKLDVDVPLGCMVFGRELHTGGFLSRTELFGDLETGLNSSYLYTVNGRFVLDFLGKIWKLRWLGVGSSYFWSDTISGWSAGIDIRFKF